MARSAAVTPFGRKRPTSFPLAADLRHRLIVVAAVLLGAALLCIEYATRMPVYRAVAMVDAPIATSYFDPATLPESEDSGPAAVSVQAAHRAAEQRLLSAAIALTGDRATATPRIRGPFGREQVPRLALRASNRSEIVRIVVVAAAPGEAVELANAAANILFAKERQAWLSGIETAAKTGRSSQAVQVNGASIAVIGFAHFQGERSPLVRRIATIVAALSCAAFAVCIGALAADTVASVGARGKAGSLADLAVPVAAVMRVPAASAGAIEDGDSSAAAVFSVEPALWQNLESIAFTAAGGHPDYAMVLVVGPVDAFDPNGAAGAVQCRSAAVHLARMAAMSGRKVLFIDADTSDYAARSLSDGIPRVPGLAEALTDRSLTERWLLQDQEIPSLLGLSAGCREMNADLLGGASIRRFMEESAGVAEWIVVSAGPIFDGHDVRPLWAEAGFWTDAAIIIGDSDVPASKTVARAALSLLRRGVPVIGQVTWAEAANPSEKSTSLD